MEKKLQLIQTIWDVMALLSALHFPSETTSLVLVSRIQKRGGTGDNNFGKWKGTFQSEWPKWPDQSLWTPFKAQVPNIPVRPNRNGPFHLWTYRNFRNFWLEWKAPVVYESATLILNPLSSRASGNCFMCYESGIRWMLKFIQTFFYPVTQQDWAQFFTVNTVFKMATLFQGSLSLTLRGQGKGVNLNLLLAFSFDFWADSTILLAIR